MRVAMFMPDLRPGSMSWTIYQGFAAGLRRHGIDFRLLTDAPDPCPPEVPGTEFLPLRAPGTTDRALAPLLRVTRFRPIVEALTGYLRTHADTEALYMEMAYPLAAAARLAARRARWPGALVVAPMGEDVLVVREAAYGFRRHWLPRRLVDRTLREAAAIRWISPAVRAITAGYGVPGELIPLNVADATVAAARRDPQVLARDRATARERLRAAAGLEREHLVLSLGRLHPFKGLHVLVRAMEGLPEAELVIVGPSLVVRGFGDYAAYLRGRARELGLAGRVRILGAAPHAEVLAYLAGADALVVPSLQESLNRVCVEAAAAGTPFVVTSSTGVAGFLGEPGVGLVVPPRSPAAIREALREIFTGSFARDEVAVRAFVERFSTENVTPRVAELLRAAVSGRRPAPAG